jgi:hypothetical protein
MASDTSSLLSELDQLLSQNDIKQPILPSSQLLYRIGGVLSRLKNTNSEPATLLQNAYQQLVLTLPQSYLWKFLETYQKAMAQMMLKNGSSSSSSSSSPLADLELAVESLYGLLAHSPLACRLACDSNASQQDLMISSLASIYDRFIVLESSSSESSSANTISRPRAAILGCLSHLFLDGLLSLQLPMTKMASSPQQSTPINNALERVLDFIKAMEEESTDCLGDLQEWQLQKEPLGRTLATSLQEYAYAIATKNNNSHEQDDDTSQMAYLLNMLESARQKTPTSTITTPTANSQPKIASAPAPKQVSAADELERRIQQVQQILPDLGQGFIETALSLFQGNVETTVATLVNDPLQYPHALRVLDRNLPRRRKERSAEEVVESQEARALVKERVALEEQQEQARYKALVYVAAQEAKANADANGGNTEFDSNNTTNNEYDDDYDDQYDDMDGGLGGADSGWSDMEVMKTYNQVARQEHAEDSFWEENRNTNRKPAPKQQQQQQQQHDEEGDENDDGPSGKKWGADKIKGGRVLGPDGKVVKNQRRGKKGGNANNSNSNNNATATAGSTTPQPQKGKSPNNTNAAANANAQAGGPNKPKPKTKPKKDNRDNRVGRQRDRKQQKQGTFGAPQS